MRVIVNTKRAKRNRRVANMLTFISIPVIFLSFFFVNPSLVGDATGNTTLGTFVSGVALIVTLATVIVAVKMTNAWVRPPRPENALNEGLKGVSNKSVLYSYYHKDAEHILVTPQGIFPLIIRFQDGRFSVTRSTWQTKKSVPAKMLGFLRFDGIGNPNEDAAKTLKYVDRLLSIEAKELTIQPLIVFISPTAEVAIENPAIPVVYANSKKKPNIKDYLRQRSKSRSDNDSPFQLNTSDMEAFEKAILSS